MKEQFEKYNRFIKRKTQIEEKLKDIEAKKAEEEKIKKELELLKELKNKYEQPWSAWITPEQAQPNDGDWVLHTYAGVRMPEYGMYAQGRFWRDAGPESFPTTHWMRIPMIDEINNEN